MSLPEEEIRALQWANQFLSDLGYGYHWDKDPFETIRSTHKRVPKSVREHARIILRHYPGRSAILAYWRKPDSSDRNPPPVNRKRVVTRRSQARK